MTYKYFIEFNGEVWQSVFPAEYSDKSQLHPDADDALFYMVTECGVPADCIRIVPTHIMTSEGVRSVR